MRRAPCAVLRCQIGAHCDETTLPLLPREASSKWHSKENVARIEYAGQCYNVGGKSIDMIINNFNFL